MKKPYVIIHTLTSLDGKIHAVDLPEFDLAALQYEQLFCMPTSRCSTTGRSCLNLDRTTRRSPFRARTS